MRRALLFGLAPLLLLAACKDEPEQPRDRKAVAAPAQAASPARKAAPKGAARHVKEADDLYEFDYAYPAAAGAIPALKAMFDAHIDKVRGELITEAKEEKALSGGDFVYHPHSRSFDWQVVTELPGWLSLSTLASTYTGGAHPPTGLRACCGTKPPIRNAKRWTCSPRSSRCLPRSARHSARR